MRGAPTKLAVLDPDSDSWVRHPWQEVHARSENVADRIVDDGSTAVGLVGEPTVEFLAAIPGTFFAGAALSILPGPIRRADPRQWAQTTLDRFRSIGVTTVFSHGAELELLRGRRRGNRRPRSRRCRPRPPFDHFRRTPDRRRRDPAGHCGFDGNSTHSADFARGRTGQSPRIDRACQHRRKVPPTKLVADLPRYGPGRHARIHAGAGRPMASAHKGLRRQPVWLVELAQLRARPR